MNLSETAAILHEKYGSLALSTKQIAEVLHFKVPGSC